MSDSPHFVHEHNRRAWDARVQRRDVFTRPAVDEDFANPLAVVDRHGWLGPSIAGRRVLCLAGGGGSQSALYAAAGARVTVVDISSEMLALDRQVAAERGLEMDIVQASMDDLSALPAAGYDIVIHPVSTCYVPDVLAVYREVARVTVSGGLYVSQHKQPASLQASIAPSACGYELTEPYYRIGTVARGRGQPASRAGHVRILAPLGATVGRHVPSRLCDRRPRRAAARRSCGRDRQLCASQPLCGARMCGSKPAARGTSGATQNVKLWTP